MLILGDDDVNYLLREIQWLNDDVDFFERKIGEHTLWSTSLRVKLDHMEKLLREEEDPLR